MIVVLSWDKTEDMTTVYNSLQSFIPLLNCFESPAIQLYAVWALNYSYSKDRKKTIYK
jgi:Zyg-11 family protein